MKIFYGFKKGISTTIFAILIIMLTGCKKEWFAAKSDKSLVIPTTISDCQSLLDNTYIMGTFSELGEAGADNYYVTNSSFLAGSVDDRNIYTWDKNPFQGDQQSVWTNSYNRIFYANVSIDALDKLDNTEKAKTEWKRAKAIALYYRAENFFQLADKFAKPYDIATAGADLGIVLKLDPEVKEAVARASLKRTYEQIISDLTDANATIPTSELLPTNYIYRTRPTKTTITALLARVYLSMSNFDKALEFANVSLSLYNKLMDFNSLNLSAPYPIPDYNSEMLLENYTTNFTLLASNKFFVDSVLYKSYSDNDLRKTVFFASQGNNTFNYRGGYTGSSNLFMGLTTSEVYLTRAECYARKGDKDSALMDLNTLLINRWKKNTFIPLTSANANDALQVILTERRKELVFREIRWMDLRRLNKDPQFAIQLTRIVNGVTYTLPPNDLRYVYPIPIGEIRQSGIEQNIR